MGSGVHHHVQFPGIVLGHGGVGIHIVGELQGGHAHAVGVIVPLRRRQRHAVRRAAGQHVGPVGGDGGQIHIPAGLAHHVSAHRAGGRGGADGGEEVGTVAVEGHHQGMLVGGGHLQGVYVAGAGLLIARHHVQQRGVGGGGLRIHQPLPGEHKVTGGDAAAIRPGGALPQGEGVGLGAVQIVRHLVAAAHGRHHALGGQLHQVFKQVARQGLFRVGGHQSRIQRGGAVGHGDAQRKARRGLPGAAGRQRQHQGQAQRQQAYHSSHGQSPLLWESSFLPSITQFPDFVKKRGGTRPPLSL